LHRKEARVKQVTCPKCGTVLDVYNVSEVEDGFYYWADLYGPAPVVDSEMMKDSDDEE